MKRAVIALLAMAFLAGCATKEEKARTNLTKVWQISKVYSNGQDITVSYLLGFGDYRISFSNNGEFTEDYYPFSGGSLLAVTGIWEFSDGINQITLTDNNQTRIYSIQLLDEQHLNVIDLGSNNSNEIHLIPD